MTVLAERHARQTAAIIECISPDARHAARDLNARQAAAIVECTASNARHAIRNLDARQPAAIIERSTFNARQLAVFTKCHARQAAAIPKCLILNARHAIRNLDARQTDAIVECIIPDARYPVWDLNTCQIAVGESHIADGCDPFRQNQVAGNPAMIIVIVATALAFIYRKIGCPQRCAINRNRIGKFIACLAVVKGVVIHHRHAVGNIDFLQIQKSVKRAVSYKRDPIGDRDRL